MTCAESVPAKAGFIPPVRRYCRTLSRCCIVMLALSLLSFHSVPVSAEPTDSNQTVSGNKGSVPITAGEYEKGLEQLDKTHRLFPLNETITRKLAEGYATFGHHLFKKKQYEKADENFSRATELYPDDASYALLRGICNYYLKKYDIARYELEHARSIAGDSVETLYFLGLVLYETDNRLDAVELWELALKLAPGRNELLEILKKARKETAVEASMDRGHSSRFDLTYDPGVDSTFALAVLDVLESAANTVTAELDHFPQARVPVGIYKRKDFKTVTDSPDWSGGVYDGKIRLPFGTLLEITPAMRGVLFHEYAHVVVFDLTHGNCPLWLNEGIAEMFGRMQYNPPMIELEHALLKRNFVDFRKLEGNFTSLSRPDAAIAYQQSYSLVNFLVTTYGWYKVKLILTNLGLSMNMDSATVTAFKEYNLSYDDLVREWRDFMVGSYSTK
jgi:tetratricopeptide (TPR) repeat protein